jgi:hypothetical protein
MGEDLFEHEAPIDGKFYRQSECYDVSVDNGGAEKSEKAACK